MRTTSLDLSQLDSRYEYTHTEDRMWRKNRAESFSFLNIITNCRGVDLNRQA